MSRKTRSGSCALDRRQRLDAVARLADDLDLVQLLELVAQLLPRELFIVDDEDFAQRDALMRVICSGATSSGTSMRALRASAGLAVSVSW